MNLLIDKYTRLQNNLDDLICAVSYDSNFPYIPFSTARTQLSKNLV